MTEKQFKDIKTGVIGVGSMGVNHARVYSEISNLVGVADPDERRGTEVAEKFSIQWFKDYKELLPHVDCVSIVVPTSMHKKVSEVVANSKVNLIVEKPLSGSSDESFDIISVSENNGVVLSVGHIERYNSVIKKVKQILDSKEFGEVISINARRFSSYPTRITDVGVLFDLSIHDVDIISYLLNDKVESVFANGGSIVNQDNEDHINLSLTFSKGKIGFCETNWLSPVKVRDINILTTTGIIYADYLDQKIRLTSNVDERLSNNNLPNVKEISVNYEEPLKTELIDFLNACLHDVDPSVTGEAGLNAVKAVEAGLKSIKERKVIHL